jgi:hypothetical protein
VEGPDWAERKERGGGERVRPQRKKERGKTGWREEEVAGGLGREEKEKKEGKKGKEIRKQAFPCLEKEINSKKIEIIPENFRINPKKLLELKHKQTKIKYAPA